MEDVGGRTFVQRPSTLVDDEGSFDTRRPRSALALRNVVDAASKTACVENGGRLAGWYIGSGAGINERKTYGKCEKKSACARPQG